MSDFFCFASAKVGQKCKVVMLDEKLEEKIFRRLCEFGFCKDAEIEIVRWSVLGKSCIVKIASGDVVMRKNIVEGIFVR